MILESQRDITESYVKKKVGKITSGLFKNHANLNTLMTVPKIGLAVFPRHVKMQCGL